MNPINFSLLRKANITRLPKYRNQKGEINHKKSDGSDWLPEQWLQAFLGEVGEFANFRKKYERGDYSVEEFKILGGKELADTQIYLDLLAMRCLDFNGEAHATGLHLGKLPSSTINKCSHQSNLTAPRCLQALTAKIGKYCELRESLEQGDLDYASYVAELPDIFANIQGHLELLSANALNTSEYRDINGIDLWTSTIDKFNEVSVRVNVSVFIENDQVLCL